MFPRLRKLAIIVLTAFCVLSFSRFRDVHKNHLDELDLRGPVKEMYTYRYTATLEGDTVRKGIRMQRWNDDWSTERHFDRYGNQTLKKYYDTNDSLRGIVNYTYNDAHQLTMWERTSNDTTVHGKLYRYDAGGNLVYEENFIRWQPGNKRMVEDSTIYGYDSLGREETKKHVDWWTYKNSFSATLVYDVWGRVSTEKYFDHEGELKYQIYNYYNTRDQLRETYTPGSLEKGGTRVTYSYNGKNRCVEDQSVRDGEIQYHHKYLYYDSGKLHQIWYYSGKKDELRDIVSYDTLGNITEESSYSNGEFASVFHYVYEFDSYQNWVRCTKYSNGEVRTIEERRILYY